MSAGYIPYCGNAPTPGSATWNLGPNLLIVLLAALLIYAAVFSREPTMNRRQALCFGAGWLVLALALISPLCNLSVALFSVRVGQHMIIALIAAPLLVAGGVDRMMEHAAFGRLSPPQHREVVLATLAFAGAVWFWHMPAPYDATFHSDITYWTMHVTMLAAALALWRVLLRSPPGPMLVSSLLTGMQMFGLGAIIALTSTELYPVHLTTTWPWGLSPLQDQSLGGLIMWVPGGLILTLEVLAALGVYLARLDRAERSPST